MPAPYHEGHEPDDAKISPAAALICPDNPPWATSSTWRAARECGAIGAISVRAQPVVPTAGDTDPLRVREAIGLRIRRRAVAGVPACTADVRATVSAAGLRPRTGSTRGDGPGQTAIVLIGDGSAILAQPRAERAIGLGRARRARRRLTRVAEVDVAEQPWSGA